MKKNLKWQLILASFLICMSILVYFIHYLVFHDLHHIFIYLTGDIAFTFLEVLIVTIILHQLLGYREKQALKRKLNMIIGVFFSELGLDLLKNLNKFNKAEQNCFERLGSDKNENVKFSDLKRTCKQYEVNMSIERADLGEIKALLISKRAFIVSLLENPSILEHNTFSNMMWAVIHLSDELTHRKDVYALGENDKKHIKIDIDRAYRALISEWISYMEHLSRDYPFLYSFAVRKNPFNNNACIEIT